MARIRSEPDKYEEIKRNDRERWAKKKETLKAKTNHEIESQRKKWREAKKRSRKKSVTLPGIDSIKDVLPTTLHQSLQTSEAITHLRTNFQTPASCAMVSSSKNCSTTKHKVRKKLVTKDSTKVYEEINKLKILLQKEKGSI